MHWVTVKLYYKGIELKTISYSHDVSTKEVKNMRLCVILLHGKKSMTIP